MVVRDPEAPLHYTLKLRSDGKVEERLAGPPKSGDGPKDFQYFPVRIAQSGVRVVLGERSVKKLKPEDKDPQQSLLSEIRDPAGYPEITRLGKLFDRIRLYREWTMGRFAAPRQPQPVDMEKSFLREDASNLALVLNRMELDGGLDAVERYLTRFRRIINGSSPNWKAEASGSFLPNGSSTPWCLRRASLMGCCDSCV